MYTSLYQIFPDIHTCEHSVYKSFIKVGSSSHCNAKFQAEKNEYCTCFNE